MANKDPTSRAITSISAFVAWMTGVLVALAVGFGLVYGQLSIPFIPVFILSSLGWVVVVLILLSTLIAIIEKITR